MDTDLEAVSRVDYITSEPKNFGLTLDHIAYLLDDEYIPAQSLSEKEESVSRMLYTSMAADYAVYITEEPAEAVITQDLLEKEDFFRYKSKSILSSVGELSPVEQRVIASDLMVAYMLIVNKGVDTLYESYCDELIKAGEPVPSDSERIKSIKSSLAFGFISEMRAQRKEQEMSEKGPISLGIEIEHYDALYDLVMTYTTNNASKREDADFQALRNDFKQWEEYKPWILRKAARNNMPIISTLAESKSFKHIVDVGTKEIVLSPSASAEAMIKDVSILVESGGLYGEWNVHETLAGVKLDTNNTQVMDITLISTAAGFLKWYGTAEMPQNLIKMAEEGRPLFKETFCKLSKMPDGTTVYYPFHKVRESEKLIPYLPGQTNATERRSMPSFDKSAFNDFTDDTRFSYMAAWCIHALQMDPTQRSERELSLLNAWNSLMGSWNSLLAESGIHNPTNEERFIKVDNPHYNEMTDSALLRGKTVYEVSMSQIAVRSYTSEYFKQQSQQLVYAFCRDVSRIIS